MKILMIFAAALSMAAVSTAASAAQLIKIHAEGMATGPAGAGGLIYSGQPIVVDAMFDLSDGTRITGSGQDTIYGAGEAQVSLELLSGTWGTPFSALGFSDGSVNSALSFSLMDSSMKYLMTMTVIRAGDQFASLDTPPIGEICTGSVACTGLIRDPNGGTTLNNVQLAWSNVTVSLENTAVPEPSTWALMILGFGGVGTLLRRRRYAYA